MAQYLFISKTLLILKHVNTSYAPTVSKSGTEFLKESSEKFFDGIFHKNIYQSFPMILITGHGTKKVLPKEILNPEDCDIPMCSITTLIVHSTKLLNFDWWRAVQLIPNCTP